MLLICGRARQVHKVGHIGCRISSVANTCGGARWLCCGLENDAEFILSETAVWHTRGTALPDHNNTISEEHCQQAVDVNTSANSTQGFI